MSPKSSNPKASTVEKTHRAMEDMEGFPLEPGQVTIPWGFDIHPEGSFHACPITGVAGARGPFGPWFRFEFTTPKGKAYYLVGPGYTPGRELEQLALAICDHPPDALDPTVFLHQICDIEVVHCKEHGATCAVVTRVAKSSTK